jgi:hypothetical protein
VSERGTGKNNEQGRLRAMPGMARASIRQR